MLEVAGIDVLQETVIVTLARPNLAEQVREAILGEIASGQLGAGERIIQEQIARTLGVSRQPVQQALLLLRNLGVLRDAPGRGLVVAPLEPDQVQHMYATRLRVTSGASTPPSSTR